MPRQVKQALADADVCVKLRPDWEKSHFRRGMALEANGEDNDAIAAFEAALKTATGASNPEITRRIKHLKAKIRPSNIHVPKAKVPTKSDVSSTSTGPAGDPKWLLTAKSPGEPVAARIAAVNQVGGWLQSHLERAIRKTPGESEWFFEDKEVVAYLDAGVYGSMLDVLTHTVWSIIDAEQKGTEEGALKAKAGADLAGAAAGVLHNLIHPSLRAWNTRGQTQALLMTLQQVLQMPGCPLMHEKGVKVQQSDEVRQFTALAAKILSNPGAPPFSPATTPSPGPGSSCCEPSCRTARRRRTRRRRRSCGSHRWRSCCSNGAAWRVGTSTALTRLPRGNPSSTGCSTTRARTRCGRRWRRCSSSTTFSPRRSSSSGSRGAWGFD